VGLDAACSRAAVAAAAAAGLPPLPAKQPRGLVWGKKADYFKDREAFLEPAARLAPLFASHAAPPAVPAENALGHLSPDAFGERLASSAFFVGLGDPLLGPSALEAVAAGAMYIDPYFGHGERRAVRAELARWGSQHPYLSAKVGEPYACGARLDEPIEMSACVRKALEYDLPPLVPPDFTRNAHLLRVRDIFSPWIPEGRDTPAVTQALADLEAQRNAAPLPAATAPLAEPAEAPPPAATVAKPDDAPPAGGVEQEFKIIDGVKVGTGSSTGWRKGGRKPGTSG
jgi:hypothetical protein